MRIKEEIVYSGKHLDFIQFSYRQGGRLRQWEGTRRKKCYGVVDILTLTNDNKIVLVEQLRPSIGGKCIEFPGGLMDKKGESARQCAKRELEEETDYGARKMRKLFFGPVSPRKYSESSTIFLATDLYFIGKGKKGDDARIKVWVISLDKAEEFLSRQKAKGKAIHDKVFLAVSWLKDNLAKKNLPIKAQNRKGETR